MSSNIKIRVKDNVTVFTATTTSGGGNFYYTGATPSTITLGGINAGSILTGKTFSTLFQELLVVYQSPAFGSFSFAGQSNTIEVGIGLSGTKTSNWSTTNSGNVQANSIAVRDVTTNTLIASGLANDGSENMSIGTITNTSPISHSWRAEGVNTNSVAFQSSNFTVSSIYPFFYGVANSRPTASGALVSGGTKVVGVSTGSINITFNATAQYLWFAVPTSSGIKSSWFVSSLNNGSIGGSVSPAGNLFPDADSVSVTTVLWSGVSYRVYSSNYATTTTGSMQLS